MSSFSIRWANRSISARQTGPPPGRCRPSRSARRGPGGTGDRVRVRIRAWRVSDRGGSPVWWAVRAGSAIQVFTNILVKTARLRGSRFHPTRSRRSDSVDAPRDEKARTPGADDGGAGGLVEGSRRDCPNTEEDDALGRPLGEDGLESSPTPARAIRDTWPALRGGEPHARAARHELAREVSLPSHVGG